MMATATDSARQIVLLRILLLATDELLCVQVLLVDAPITAAKETIVHLGLHLGLLAGDDVGVGRIGNLLIPSRGLVRVLALGSLRDVLQNVALDLHAPVVSVIGDLDEAVEVVVRGRRVTRSVRAAARCPIDVLLPGHSAVLGLYG